MPKGTRLTGKKIAKVRKLTADELEAECWNTSLTVMALELEDGTLVYSSRDEKGSGPGELFINNHGNLSCVT